MIAKYLILVALLLQIPVTHVQAASTPNLTIRVLEDLRKPYTPPEFPDMTSNYKKMVEEKVVEAERLSALKAAEMAQAAQQAQDAAQQSANASAASRMPQTASYDEAFLPPSGLMGSMGHATAGGNCVNEPGINNPFDGTNPISWAVLSSSPWIGATVLFTWNHTGVVTGIWSNGDVEVRHQNCSRCPTRYSQDLIRGYR